MEKLSDDKISYKDVDYNNIHDLDNFFKIFTSTAYSSDWILVL